MATLSSYQVTPPKDASHEELLRLVSDLNSQLIQLSTEIQDLKSARTEALDAGGYGITNMSPSTSTLDDAISRRELRVRTDYQSGSNLVFPRHRLRSYRSTARIRQRGGSSSGNPSEPLPPPPPRGRGNPNIPPGSNDPLTSGRNIISPNYASFEDTRLPSVSGTTGGTATLETSIGYYGTQSLKLASTSANCYTHLSSGTTTYKIKLKPGKMWMITAYVYSSSATKSGKLQLKTSNAGTLYSVAFTVTAATTWERVYGIIDLRDDTSKKCHVRLDNDGGNGIAFYFDALMLEEYYGIFQEGMNEIGSVEPSAFDPGAFGQITRQDLIEVFPLDEGSRRVTAGGSVVWLDANGINIQMGDAYAVASSLDFIDRDGSTVRASLYCTKDPYNGLLYTKLTSELATENHTEINVGTTGATKSSTFTASAYTNILGYFNQSALTLLADANTSTYYAALSADTVKLLGTTSIQFGIAGGAVVKYFNNVSDLADDAYVDLPVCTGGLGLIVFGDGEGHALFYFGSDANPQNINKSGNASLSNTDGNYCVFDNGTTIRVRNRQGSTKHVFINLFYY